MRKQAVVETLKRQFPEIDGIHFEDDCLYLGNAAEGGEIDGLPAADYYGEFRGGYPWVSEKLEKALQKIGYYSEWYDSGTLIAGKLD